MSDLHTVSRLHVSTIGSRLVFGRDFDAVDHQYGEPRAVCFHLGDWDTLLEEDSVVTVEYEREKTDIDDLPPMLVGIESIDVVEQRASPDVLFDL
ncbi:hypothetical protein OB955_13195 [Halobacteria archaeon AArc-m2/3/4]|uniref:Uncharacterized protein n=1 Tax=Natronoglomus mannanivorans TaxID=2979990 RepID=A0AAP2YXS9_9EURY|nr:hypothetical protein [Halobacteria archaeon AArc-xg1-1]MCU4973690.1 hypothetical protein [Halobacteria archaeon AArc-m2/3/4]